MTLPYRHRHHRYRHHRHHHHRHHRLRGAHGRSGRSRRIPAPSDIILAVLSLVLLLSSGFVAGGLLAHPF